MALHHPGHWPGATQLAQALTRTDDAVHAAVNLHQSQAHPERRFATATLALATSRRPAKKLGDDQRRVLAISTGRCARCCCAMTARPILCWRRCREFRLLTERISGNYFTGMMVALPADLDDPLERLRACTTTQTRQGGLQPGRARLISRGRTICRRWPASPSSAGRRPELNKVLNLPISNVPGPRERGRVGVPWSPRSIRWGH